MVARDIKSRAVMKAIDSLTVESERTNRIRNSRSILNKESAGSKILPADLTETELRISCYLVTFLYPVRADILNEM